MEKEVISERQGIVLFILFSLGSNILLGTASQAKQDAWISIIIAVAGSSVILLMYSKIISYYPGKDLFDILQIIFGKYIGKLLSIFMIWFAFHMGTLVIRILSEFTNIHALPDTPVVVPMVLFIALCIYGVKLGIEVLGRWSEIFIMLVIITVVFLSILSIPIMDINKLKPILDNGFTPILSGAFSTFTFPFGEAVVLTMVFSNIRKGGNHAKIFIVGSLITGLIMLILSYRNILILGSNVILEKYFPSYDAISLIHIGDIFDRLEMIVAFEFIVCAFVKASICLLAICKGITKVFGFDDYRFIVTPVALLMLEFSFFIYKSTMQMADFADKVWPYYSLPFEVIIPVIIFIAVEVKTRKKTIKK